MQVPDASVQEDGLNVPPALPLLHNTVPVGKDGELELSAIVTVSVVCPPRFTITGFAFTVIIIELSAPAWLPVSAIAVKNKLPPKNEHSVTAATTNVFVLFSKYPNPCQPDVKQR